MQVEGVEGVAAVFRTRLDKDGALQVWAPGWRLELRFAALIPPALAVGFLLSNLPLGVRVLFAIVLAACGLVVHRMTSIGIVLTADDVRLVGIGRTRRAKWTEVAGFVGERDAHEGRPVLLTADGERLRAPGSLPSETMDTYWDETEVSAIDQLNGIVDAFRRGEVTPAESQAQRRPPKEKGEKPPRTKPERAPRVKTERPPRAKKGRRSRAKVEAGDVVSVVDRVSLVDPASVVDPAPVVDTESTMVSAGATAPSPPSHRTKGSRALPTSVPEYVAAAAERSAYPSRGAQRLAEWERTHEPVPAPESKRRRSRRRSDA
jgi:hypothetical protein